MKRLPWLLIVVMFIEIGLDAMIATDSFASARVALLSPALPRLVLAIIFAVFAFKLRPWAMIAWAIMEGFTALGSALAAVVLFTMPKLHGVAWGCVATAVVLAIITWGFIRCARQWRCMDNA